MFYSDPLIRMPEYKSIRKIPHPSQKPNRPPKKKKPQQSFHRRG